jgi:hypothetical protein
MNDKRRQSVITSLFICSTVSLALCLLLPRVIDWSNDLAEATSAALTFLAFYLLSFSLSVYLLGLVLVSLKRLSKRQRALGVVPFLLVASVGLLFLAQL